MRWLLFLSLPFTSFAQSTFSGSIIDGRSGAPIPYVTIGLKKENRGTSADENGRFSLITQSIPNDTLLLSCVGYQTLLVALASFSNEKPFALIPKATTLRTVVVTDSKGTSEQLLAALSDCGDMTLSSVGYQTQMAQPLTAPIAGATLTSVGFCNGGGLFGAEKAVFRLRIYNRDSVTGGPGEDLCAEIIEVRLNGRRAKVDLMPYDIRLPGKQFFVALEWLFIPYNYEETKQKTNGVKKKTFRYKPTLGMSNNATKELTPWMKNFQGIWHPFVKTMGEAAITATVTY